MVREKIISALKKATGIEEIELEFPEQEEFGDYATNVALVLAKKEGKNSKEVAEEIATKLRSYEATKQLFGKIEVAGPGFINFWLSKEALIESLKETLKEEDNYGSSRAGKEKTVVIDYSSPNIAKRFGIGHLRSTVIGQALYNLYEFLGYKVIGDNHLGDWGTQFGSIIAEVKSQKLKVKSLSIDDLERIYVDFNKKAESNPKLWDEARAHFKKLEEGDRETRKIWQAIVDISLAEFARIYKLLGVKIDYAYGESFYEGIMPSVVEDIRKRKLSKKSQGAEIIKFPDLLPAMLIKSDGTTTYFTRDLATVAFRLRKWNPDLFIYEVGSDQTLHFKQLFETVRLLGWAKDKEFVHVAHGLIRFPHGKMSTRAGQTIKLEEVLSKAIERARKIIDKSETSRGLTEGQKGEVAKAVGIGAVKYFDLMHHPTSDIIFDWEKMFVLEGNSAPYLQYTVARTNSVLAKVKSQRSKVKTINHLTIKPFNHEEELVLRTLSRFPEIIETAAKNYSPNLLCNYLFDLAQKFNNFYNQYRILDQADSGAFSESFRCGGSPSSPPRAVSRSNSPSRSSTTSAFRIALTAATGHVLKNGLKILGIEAPERM